MHSTLRRLRPVALVLAALVLLPALSGCPERTKFRVRLFNNTNVTLEPYIVENLVRVPEGTKVGHGDTFSIGANGFNVAFYSSAPVAAGQPNALYVQMSFDPNYGRELLTRVCHNIVPPGQEGTDPSKQLVPLDDYPFTIPADATGVQIRVEPGLVVSYQLD